MESPGEKVRGECWGRMTLVGAVSGAKKLLPEWIRQVSAKKPTVLRSDRISERKGMEIESCCSCSKPRLVTYLKVNL